MKKILSLILIGALSLSVLAGCSGKKVDKKDNDSKPAATDTKKEGKKEEVKDTGNRLDKAKEELKKKGFNVGENEDIMFGMVGATNGYKFKVNDQLLELYIYEESKLTDEGKEMFKQAKKGSVSFSGINVKVAYINDFVVARLDEHKDKDKIIEVLKSIK